MKTTLSTIAIALSVLPTTAQTTGETYDKPYYLPCEGMYYVGLPGSLADAVDEPTIITQAYQAKFKIYNTDLAAIKAGAASYNLSKYISDEGDELNIIPFMGVGNAADLVVRNYDNEAYKLGDNAPRKTWINTRLLAAHPRWRGRANYPLAVYDQWDCPITFDADDRLSTGKSNAVTVDFGNPHEGLVVSGVNFPLVVAPTSNMDSRLSVTLSVWNDDRTTLLHTYTKDVTLDLLDQVSNEGDNAVYDVECDFGVRNIVINTPFTVTVDGFAADNLQAWLPRAVDRIGIYPTHTSYDNASGEGDAAPAVDKSSDVCINVDGYFNYLGTWGWYDGKSERGEVVGAADLVQIYYDPEDEDWPGDYFMGEAAFPVECTFGSGDITIYSMPDWINSISYDDSTWDEYGAVQISISADALPSDLTGRNGKVVLCTTDQASFYTIYLRQGSAWFDFTEGVGSVTTAPSATTDGPLYNMKGQRIAAPQKGQPYIRGGKTCIEL